VSDAINTSTPPREIIAVHPDAEEMSRQRLPYFVGISQQIVARNDANEQESIAPYDSVSA